MRPENAAYIAGFFDADGCVIIRCDKGRYFDVMVNTVQTHEAILRHMCNVSGYGRIHEMKKISTRFENEHKSWQWVMASKMAYQFLVEIEPYLILKKRQAQIAIEFHEFKATRQGKVISDERISAYQNYRDALQNEKKLGKVLAVVS